MAIYKETALPVARYIANGTDTDFVADFVFKTADELIVYKERVLQHYSSDFTIVGDPKAGTASIRFFDKPLLKDVIVVYRWSDIERETDFNIAGNFRPNYLDSEFNKVYRLINENRMLALNAVRFDDVDMNLYNGELPKIHADLSIVIDSTETGVDLGAIAGGGGQIIKQATEERLGIAEIATQFETDKGTDDERFITPKKLQARLEDSGALSGVKRIKGNNSSGWKTGEDIDLDLDADFNGAKKNGDSANNFNVKTATSGAHAVPLQQLNDEIAKVGGVKFTAFRTPIVIHPKAQLPSNTLVNLSVAGHDIPDGALVFVNFTAYPDIAGTAVPDEKIYGLINHGDSSTIATADNANFECAGEDNGSRTFGGSGQVTVMVKEQRINVSRTTGGGKDQCFFTAAISGWMGSA